jgi:hypothetical protein
VDACSTATGWWRRCTRPRRHSGREGSASAAASGPHSLGQTARTGRRTVAVRGGAARGLRGPQRKAHGAEPAPEEPVGEEGRGDQDTAGRPGHPARAGAERRRPGRRRPAALSSWLDRAWDRGLHTARGAGPRWGHQGSGPGFRARACHALAYRGRCNRCRPGGRGVEARALLAGLGKTESAHHGAAPAGLPPLRLRRSGSRYHVACGKHGTR